jgi:ribosomal protein S18 acetylase RimI-like enzyme
MHGYGEFRIERLKSKDIESLLSVGVAHDEFAVSPDKSDFWTRRELQDWLADPQDICLGVRNEKDDLLAYCLTHWHQAANKVYIENIYVASDWRHLGLGKRLLLETKTRYMKDVNSDGIRFVGLVLDTNVQALRAFEAAGYKMGATCVWLEILTSRENDNRATIII